MKPMKAKRPSQNIAVAQKVPAAKATAGRKFRSVSVQLLPSEIEELSAFAEREARSLSSLIRLAVRHMLTSLKEQNVEE